VLIALPCMLRLRLYSLSFFWKLLELLLELIILADWKNTAYFIWLFFQVWPDWYIIKLNFSIHW